MGRSVQIVVFLDSLQILHDGKVARIRKRGMDRLGNFRAVFITSWIRLRVAQNRIFVTPLRLILRSVLLRWLRWLLIWKICRALSMMPIVLDWSLAWSASLGILRLFLERQVVALSCPVRSAWQSSNKMRSL